MFYQGRPNSGRPTRRNALWMCGVMVAAAACLLQAVLARTTVQGILVTNGSYDAGRVNRDATIQDAVQVTNLSARLVTLTTISTCGCTTAEVTEKALAPLHHCTVTARVNVRGIPAGEHRRFLYLCFRSEDRTWQQTASIRFRVR